MQKVKNLLHRNKDDAAHDNTHNTTTHNNTATHNPLDRNHDGRVDAKDLTGRQTTTTGTHNPLDRNHDGRVDAADLTGRQTNVLAPGMTQTTTSTTTEQTLLNNSALDRNHDGRIDSRDFATTGLASTTVYEQSAQRGSIGVVRAEPTVIETIQKDVVVHEHIHPVQKEEIQPVIYREREQLDVKQVTQMMHETMIQPTLVEQRELPAERREAIIERGAPIAENYVAPSREVDATLTTQVVHAPIVNEVIKKTIIEEIQPVLERDIITSTIIQNTQPIYEKIVEAPTVYRETVVVHQDRGIVGGDIASLEAQGFNLGATGRRLSQTYATAPLGTTGVHHNPLDRNHDGVVDARDFTGQPGHNQGELLGHRGLTTANPLDRNNDGKVDLKDLSGRQDASAAHRPVTLH